MNLAEILLRPDVWRGEAAAPVPAVATGFATLDAVLPGGGWPRAALTEVTFPRPGIGELQLFLPALAALSRGDRWVAFIAPPYIPYAPALNAAGVDLSRLLMVYPKTHSDQLWAVETSLRSGACAMVLAWATYADSAHLRRLQLAAEAGATGAVLFQRYSMPGSTAALRLRLESDPDDARLNVHVLKRRGGGPAGPFALDIRHDWKRPEKVRPRTFSGTLGQSQASASLHFSNT